MRTVVKFIIALNAVLFAGSAAFASQFEATLVKRSANSDDPYASTGCPPAIAVTQNEGSVIVASPQDGMLIERYDNINRGRLCHKNNSSHTFGGYECETVQMKETTVSKYSCQTELLNFKCNPLSKREVVTKLSVSANGTVVFDKEHDYYTGQRIIVKCEYQVKGE